MLLVIMTYVFFVLYMLLKKFIGESFYNPILLILPVLIFLHAEDFTDLITAWIVSMGTALALVVYARIKYRSLLLWILLSVVIYILNASIISLSYLIQLPEAYRMITGEYITALYFALLLFLKKPLERIIIKFSDKKLSMQNNLIELQRLLIILLLLMFLYADSYIAVENLTHFHKEASLAFVRQTYLIILLFVIIYQFIRVYTVRAQLLKEEWWPIYNENGKSIGTIQQFTSLWDENKYRHPVVRVVLLEGNRIFLQENNHTAEVYPNKWDNLLTAHVRVGETTEDAISRIAKNRFGVGDLKTVFLMNYAYETDQEIQHVHLYIAGAFPPYFQKPADIDHLKWWTIGQIEDNAGCLIFSEQFIREFEILLRSGLVVSCGCQCECRLRETFLDTDSCRTNEIKM